MSREEEKKALPAVEECCSRPILSIFYNYIITEASGTPNGSE